MYNNLQEKFIIKPEIIGSNREICLLGDKGDPGDPGDPGEPGNVGNALDSLHCLYGTFSTGEVFCKKLDKMVINGSVKEVFCMAFDDDGYSVDGIHAYLDQDGTDCYVKVRNETGKEFEGTIYFDPDV